ncbi:MAG: DNA repair protein RecN [Candidatus Anammoxibacter sp.]
MLRELYISNFALIDNITIDLDAGLNIFTGSTGVGKSLIMGALNFLLGSRVTSDIIRTDKKEATVNGVFLLKNADILENLRMILDEPLEEELIITRSLDKSGRNKCKINNKPITVSVLKEIGESLVNIHGQHEHESVTNPANQLTILDSFGKANELRNTFSDTYKLAVQKENYLFSLKENQDIKKREIDLCRFETKEIEDAELKPDEIDALEDERKILANAEAIQSTVSSCFENLYETDNSIIERLRVIANNLDKISEFDKKYSELAKGCNQSVYQLEEVSIELRDNGEGHNVDPDRIDEIGERIETIRRLREKYGQTVDDILDHYKKSKQRLETLLKENEDLGSAEDDLAKLKQDLLNTGKKLSQLRKKAAAKLSQLVKDELGDLGITNGQFDVEVYTVNVDGNANQFKIDDVTGTGFDRVEFMFSSNAGEKTRPLRKVASGGEISRVMLALKRQLARADNTPVLVFDEIDSNIGGRMGKIIGEKLKTVSLHHQIICITHLPQIASYADQHLKVIKTVKDNRTMTEIDTLSGKALLEEVAEMIRGNEKTDVTRKQAKEMIDDAKRFKPQ